MELLRTLTLVYAGIVVLVLAFALVLIWRGLRGVAADLEAVGDALDGAAARTRPLEDRMQPLRDRCEGARNALGEAERRLGRAEERLRAAAEAVTGGFGADRTD